MGGWVPAIHNINLASPCHCSKILAGPDNRHRIDLVPLSAFEAGAGKEGRKEGVSTVLLLLLLLGWLIASS